MSEELMEAQEMEEDSQKDMYMTFKSGNEYFGISIQCVNEIIGFQAITEVPETVDYIKGLINLRGKIIPVIDVRLRFNQAPIEYDDRTCIIVITVKTVMIGLIVEKIADVVTIHSESITPPPSISHRDNASNKYVYGIGKVKDEVKLLLDPDRLINDADIDEFEELIEDEDYE